MGLADKYRQRRRVSEPAAWQGDLERLQALIATAQSFTGATNAEVPLIPVSLDPGEHALLVLPEMHLIEPRRLPGHFMGGNAGFTFAVARQGADRPGRAPGGPGPGPEGPTPIDTGTVTVTDRRTVFSGSLHTRTWAYATVIGYHHNIDPPWTAIPVSDRQRISGLRYGQAEAEGFRFALALGMARFHDAVPSLLTDLQLQLEELERERPAGSSVAEPDAPAGIPPGVTDGGEPLSPPGWYPDPYRVARLRWWDGRSWTGHAAP